MGDTRDDSQAGGPVRRALPIGAKGAAPVEPPATWRVERKGSRRRALAGLTPDLARNIGSSRWFRGLATLVGLSAAAIAFWPGIAPVSASPATRMDQAGRDELRSQMITPLALGAESGRRMGATGLVRPLAAAPERPQVELLATLGGGATLEGTLRRAGVGSADAERVLALVGAAIDLADLESGTQIDITLGRRPAEKAPRPLKSLAFRARFDLALEVGRDSDTGPLALTRTPIRVDETPLRIRGTVGPSLYRSARAAGAPASAVQAYLKALGQQIDIGSLRASDTFDIIVQHRRAATGERQAGALLYAGVDRDEKPSVQLMRWGRDGQFYEASGVGEQRSGLVAPVPGRVSSGFGMRRHPILKYKRMHAGLDFKASYGTPIVAVTEGRVSGAGRMGGCGNAVRLNHASGLQTRYCHMSRIAVSSGQSVRRGQVIGYVGSTGLSTGAHLHYEMYRGGRAVDPASVKFVTRAQLSGAELAQFRDTLATIKQVEAGAALTDLVPTAAEQASEEPQREIDRVDKPQKLN